MGKILDKISNIGTDYENDYFEKQNVKLQNRYAIVMFGLLIIIGVRNYFAYQATRLTIIFFALSLFFLIATTLFNKLIRKKIVLFICFLIFDFVIFYFEAVCGGLFAGIYLYYFSLLFVLPFIFNVLTDMYYIVAIVICVIITFFINVLTNYSLLIPLPAPDVSLSYLHFEKNILYASLIYNFIIMGITFIFLIQKIRLMGRFYTEKEIAVLKSENMEQNMKLKNLEVLQAKQNLIITNLRISQKNEIIEKIKNLNNQQMDMMVQQEKLKDKNFDITTKLYMDISPEFYKILNEEAAPNKLTPLDIQYCTYIFYRKSNKDIAEMLNVNYNTVKSHKRHLKHKFNLTNAENLDFFIQQIKIIN